MRFLPVFERGHARLAGDARCRDEEGMFLGKAICLGAPGAAVTLRARGRELGIMFFRHDWSGIVEITIAGRTHRVDLFSPMPMTWIFEASLPDSWSGTDVTVRVVREKHEASKAHQAWIQAAYTSQILTSEIPDLLLDRVDPDPFTGWTLNQLTDVFKWYDPEWMAAMRSLGCSPPYQPPDFVHRKSWEWTHCLFGLDCLGSLRPEHRGLGVGVGWEPLSFFLSNHVGEVVATDLYPARSEWSEAGVREGNPEILDDPDKFAPFPYRRDRLRFLSMDGRRLDFPEDSFDFVWSCSSIEHFGGHEGSAQSMREIDRILRPGGIACVITEYVLPDPATGRHALFDREFFNLRCLWEYIVRPAERLRLIQRLDLTIPDYYVRRACVLPHEAGAPHSGSTKPHVVLRAGSGALVTSIALFFRKEGGTRPLPPPTLWAGRGATLKP